jgi:hypothetical protein
MLLGSLAVSAHVSDKGMDYEKYKNRDGGSCCNDQDCRPAADFVDTHESGQPVVRLLIDGIWITVARYHVNSASATDGRAHWCGALEMNDNKPAAAQPDPICVILPPHVN